jgi:hypothetical protein
MTPIRLLLFIVGIVLGSLAVLVLNGCTIEQGRCGWTNRDDFFETLQTYLEVGEWYSITWHISGLEDRVWVCVTPIPPGWGP